MEYFELRQHYVNNPDYIINLEKTYFDNILEGIKRYYPLIERDFNEASTIIDFWKKYAPKQRGRGPRNEAYPWGEVGEKILDAYIYKIVNETYSEILFTGLPYGHDTRFVTQDAFVQIDVKSTGPNDNFDEVVASPNQVSGNGILLNEEGITNSPIHVQGPKQCFDFQPELPPFYIISQKPRLTLTYYLKCVYKVIGLGHQPLDYIELICVPNGLIMFDTLKCCNKIGLLIPGKDIKESQHKRTRIRLNPLCEIAKWRCVKVRRVGDNVKITNRLD